MYADPLTGVGLLKGKTSMMFWLLNRLILNLIFDQSNSGLVLVRKND